MGRKQECGGGNFWSRSSWSILLLLKLVRVKPEDTSGYYIRLQHVQLMETIPRQRKIFICLHLPFKQDSSLSTSCQSSCFNQLLTCNHAILGSLCQPLPHISKCSQFPVAVTPTFITSGYEHKCDIYFSYCFLILS